MKRSYYLIRIIPFTLVILVCLYVFGMSIQATGYTDLHRMRTAEKAHMVGPSTLMGQEKSLPLWGKVMIGKSDYGYTLFCCDSGKLYYRPKATDFIAFAPMYYDHTEFFRYDDYYGTIPVIIIAPEEKAVHAKLTVITGSTASGRYEEVPFTNETNICENGYFIFRLPLGGYRYGTYIQDITELINQQKLNALSYGTVTLELFDHDGNMIASHTREVPIRQPL